MLDAILGIFVSWKTSLAGVVAFFALTAHSLWGVNITVDQQATIVAFVLLILGFVSKDNNKTGVATDES